SILTTSSPLREAKMVLQSNLPRAQIQTYDDPRRGRSNTVKKALVSIALGLTASLVASGASAQATLNSVKQKGFLTCGSNTGLAGFGLPDAQGNWTGLDVDFCRAISAAIFDDPNKVRFIPLAAKDRFTALQSGEVDVLSR